MNFPAFYSRVPRIILRDPLAEFLGASVDGLLEYGYEDVVKLAGHSCPTVAGAYLMTFQALARLYPGQTPERGAIRVELRDAASEGVTGVNGAVAGYLTGAAQEGGFKGIAGSFDRRGLLNFGRGGTVELVFRRVDGGGAVATAYYPALVPLAPEAKALLQKIAGGIGDAADRAAFASLWQARVERLLVDHFDDPDLVQLTDC